LGAAQPWSAEALRNAFRQAGETMAISREGTDPAQLNSTPTVRVADAKEIAPGVTIIPDPRINFVPNIGIIAGRDSVLVVDTGLGVDNGIRVLDLARRIAGGRALYLTLTHFHPEHGYGAQVFKGEARIVYSAAQADELNEKGRRYLEMFRGYGDHIANALEGVNIIGPDETYVAERTIDLGGRKVLLREMPAHTRGDQIVFLPEEGIVFTGDLVENAFFPIFADADSKGERWLEKLISIESLRLTIVVPGHGAIGHVDIVQAVREYMEFVRGEVGALPRGLDEDDTERRLVPKVKARYPGWDNEMWIRFAIRVFFAEATGKPLQLPSQ
jgi:glyoxylase-like metal-dependent hydrolase (beta-lactamase superfamily II)